MNVLPAGSSFGPLGNGPQLPGTIAPGANAVPQSPQSVLNLGASSPSLVPHSAAPNGVPDHASIVPPAVDGRVGSGSLGVPQAYAPSLPAVGGASPERAEAIGPAHQRPPAPSTPYYFLGESAGYPTTVQSFDVPREDRVSAQSFGLPGADDLRALLADNPRHQAQPLPAHAPTTASEQSTSPFYFAQPSRQAHGFSERVPQADEARHPGFDVHAVRRDFPVLQERVNGKQLVWFDNAATTHKPQSVIDRIAYFYAHENSNIHRAAHELAARATDAYEGAREKVRAFLGAGSVEEIIFVRGAHRSHQLGGKDLGLAKRGRGRRDHRLQPRTPRQHRAVATVGSGQGRQAQSDSCGRQWPSAVG